MFVFDLLIVSIVAMTILVMAFAFVGHCAACYQAKVLWYQNARSVAYSGTKTAMRELCRQDLVRFAGYSKASKAKGKDELRSFILARL